MELSDYREKIDSIDKELVKLFAERMDTAAEIARYKKEHGMKVLDSAPEPHNRRKHSPYGGDCKGR